MTVSRARDRGHPCLQRSQRARPAGKVVCKQTRRSKIRRGENDGIAGKVDRRTRGRAARQVWSLISLAAAHLPLCEVGEVGFGLDGSRVKQSEPPGRKMFIMVWEPDRMKSPSGGNAKQSSHVRPIAQQLLSAPESPSHMCHGLIKVAGHHWRPRYCVGINSRRRRCCCGYHILISVAGCHAGEEAPRTEPGRLEHLTEGQEPGLLTATGMKSSEQRFNSGQ